MTHAPAFVTRRSGEHGLQLPPCRMISRDRLGRCGAFFRAIKQGEAGRTRSRPSRHLRRHRRRRRARAAPRYRCASARIVDRAGRGPRSIASQPRKRSIAAASADPGRRSNRRSAPAVRRAAADRAERRGRPAHRRRVQSRIAPAEDHPPPPPAGNQAHRRRRPIRRQSPTQLATSCRRRSGGHGETSLPANVAGPRNLSGVGARSPPKPQTSIVAARGSDRQVVTVAQESEHRLDLVIAVRPPRSDVERQVDLGRRRLDDHPRQFLTGPGGRPSAILCVQPRACPRDRQSTAAARHE